MKDTSTAIKDFQETVFATLTRKALKTKSLNLAQGFPDFNGPEWLREFVQQAINDGHTQYAPAAGILPLREALANNYKRKFQLHYDPNSEISISSGATEAIYTSLQSILNPGDEVILFSPFYDSYLASIKLARATPIEVALNAPSFQIPWNDLENKVSERTKLILFNNPHNPSGQIFPKAEIEKLAKFAIEHDLYVLSDEVYEYLTFDEQKHTPLASLPGMKERTLTISSMGKTFGMTGFKVGWLATSEALTHAFRMVHQFTVFSVNTPVQHALAATMNNTDLFENYLADFKTTYQQKRDQLFRALTNLNLNPLPSQGTYFTLCPVPDSRFKTDWEFCHALIDQIGVATIPLSPFYIDSDKYYKNQYVRFCFAKKEETLHEGIERLGRFEGLH